MWLEPRVPNVLLLELNRLKDKLELDWLLSYRKRPFIF